MRKYIYCLLFIPFLASTFNRGYGQNYDLSKPTTILNLPDILREVSDITAINSATIGCIQDEKGLLFKYSLKKGQITSQDSFYVNGDYEGIAMVKNDIYVLRSDGIILEIKNGVKGNRQVKTYATNIASNNNEGLCYDKKNDRLLISSKSRSSNSTKDKRMIYAFDLATKKLVQEPVFEIDILGIKNYLTTKYSLTDTVANSIKIKPSAIAIHPFSGKLYMLSASGYLLCVFNNGVLETAERLDPILFNKAEGITFLKNGDMVVSNEGQTGSATLLLFKNGK